MKAISNKSYNDYQLISVGIELVHKILAIADCKPELMVDPHLSKANELARQWNETFIANYATQGKGEIAC